MPAWLCLLWTRVRCTPLHQCAVQFPVLSELYAVRVILMMESMLLDLPFIHWRIVSKLPLPILRAAVKRSRHEAWYPFSKDWLPFFWYSPLLYFKQKGIGKAQPLLLLLLFCFVHFFSISFQSPPPVIVLTLTHTLRVFFLSGKLLLEVTSEYSFFGRLCIG